MSDLPAYINEYERIASRINSILLERHPQLNNDELLRDMREVIAGVLRDADTRTTPPAIAEVQASLTKEDHELNEMWGHKPDCLLTCTCGSDKPYPLKEMIPDVVNFLKWKTANRTSET